MMVSHMILQKTLGCKVEFTAGPQEYPDYISPAKNCHVKKRKGGV